MSQILLIPIFVALVLYQAITANVWLSEQKRSLPQPNASLQKDPVTNRYTFVRTQQLHNGIAVTAIPKSDKRKFDKETVQKVMLRICNTIYQKGIIANCANAESVATTWSYATDIATSGVLTNVYNGTTSNTFSCGGEAQFGRYLLRQSLPSDIVSQYGYDLNGISDTDTGGGDRTYPCGYSEIVYKINF